MGQPPDVALVISSFERPHNLRLCLLSVACQTARSDQIEVVVCDDGSRDETPQVVSDFARSIPFSVKFTTHRHQGFQLARSRNEGVAATSADYLIFLDGDCILPPDYVEKHLAIRQPVVVFGGDSYRLDRESTKLVDEQIIRDASVSRFHSKEEIQRLANFRRRSLYYQFIRHPRKPKMFGANIAIHRQDFELVNGFDENFVGWGCEDDDLRLRLRGAGIKVKTFLGATFNYHLWHPPSSSHPDKWNRGKNVAYLQRSGRLIRCTNGLHKRPLEDLLARINVESSHPWLVKVLHSLFPRQATRGQIAEVELQRWPVRRRAGRAQHRVMILVDPVKSPERLLQNASSVIHVPKELSQIGLESHPEAQEQLAQLLTRALQLGIVDQPMRHEVIRRAA